MNDGKSFRKRDTSYVFTVGKLGVGKSTLLASMVYSLYTHHQIPVITNIKRKTGRRVALNDWMYGIDQGNFPPRSLKSQVIEVDIGIGEDDNGLPLTFFEMSGEDLNVDCLDCCFELDQGTFEYLAQDGVPSEILDALSPLLANKFLNEKDFVDTLQDYIGEDYLAQYGQQIVNLANRNETLSELITEPLLQTNLLVIVVPCNELIDRKQDLYVTQFLENFKALYDENNVRRAIPVALVLSKWDLKNNGLGMKELVEIYLPNTNAWLHKPMFSDARPFKFSVGEVDEPTKASRIRQFQEDDAKGVVSWIYQKLPLKG